MHSPSGVAMGSGGAVWVNISSVVVVTWSRSVVLGGPLHVIIISLIYYSDVNSVIFT